MGAAVSFQCQARVAHSTCQKLREVFIAHKLLVLRTVWSLSCQTRALIFRILCQAASQNIPLSCSHLIPKMANKSIPFYSNGAACRRSAPGRLCSCPANIGDGRLDRLREYPGLGQSCGQVRSVTITLSRAKQAHSLETESLWTVGPS